MKGLLRNQFYGALSSAVVLLIFFVAIGIGLLISGNPSLLNIYALVTATAFTFNAISGFRKEASSKWSKYELTTPVGRKEIVKSRFINHALWVLAGIILSALFVVLTLAIHGNHYFYYDVRDPLMLFCCGTGIALLMGTIFYPSIYLLGTDKSEIIMIISLLGSVGITVGIIWMLNAAYDFQPVTDTEFYLNVMIYMMIVLVSFVLSYFLTTLIYRRREC
jgi:hypothetical protein